MNYWILPCNKKYYDIDGALKQQGFVEWHQTNAKVQVGDIIYLYITKPSCEIQYKCEVVSINNPACGEKDKEFSLGLNYSHYNRYMTLKPVKQYLTPTTFTQLVELGFSGTVRCIRHLDDCFVNFIDR